MKDGAEGFTPLARERAMRMREVIVRAIGGELSWIQAAGILGVTPRTMRRWRQRFERSGYDGLWDRRRRSPSPKRAPVREVQRLLQLYRAEYSGWNVRHFYRHYRHHHGGTLSYSFVKRALQFAGLVRKRRPRGRHRQRRPPRPCFGELLHLDGSVHAWLAQPGRQTLIAVVDDATRRLLYAQLEAGETSAAVLRGLRAVLGTYGLPQALYTDRAKWAAHTPQAGGPVDKSKLTQVGRALRGLGIEHILAYSPQARGRGERVHRTLQDRLVKELRRAALTTIAAANRYLRDVFVPSYNDEFGRLPADPSPAFVPVGTADLDDILCHLEERVVGLDNTITLDGVRLQIPKQRGLRTCARRRVIVRRHLDGTHTIRLGPRLLARYDRVGQLLADAPKPQAA